MFFYKHTLLGYQLYKTCSNHPRHKSKMACRSNTKIQKILWILIVLLSEQIESGDVDTKISAVPYKANEGYEGEFYVRFAYSYTVLEPL